MLPVLKPQVERTLSYCWDDPNCQDGAGSIGKDFQPAVLVLFFLHQHGGVSNPNCIIAVSMQSFPWHNWLQVPNGFARRRLQGPCIGRTRDEPHVLDHCLHCFWMLMAISTMMLAFVEASITSPWHNTLITCQTCLLARQHKAKTVICTSRRQQITAHH